MLALDDRPIVWYKDRLATYSLAFTDLDTRYWPVVGLLPVAM